MDIDMGAVQPITNHRYSQTECVLYIRGMSCMACINYSNSFQGQKPRYNFSVHQLLIGCYTSHLSTFYPFFLTWQFRA